MKWISRATRTRSRSPRRSLAVSGDQGLLARIYISRPDVTWELADDWRFFSQYIAVDVRPCYHILLLTFTILLQTSSSLVLVTWLVRSASFLSLLLFWTWSLSLPSIFLLWHLLSHHDYHSYSCHHHHYYKRLYWLINACYCRKKSQICM